MRHLPAIVCACLLAGQAVAADWRLPVGARQVTERVSTFDSYNVPVDPFDGTQVPSREIRGVVQRRSWRMDGGASTPLQILEPLRAQLDAAGFQVVFECRDRACGGFDFRFGTEVIPAPDMAVDIGNYRFLSALRGSDQAVTILVSGVGGSSYLQMIEVLPRGQAARSGQEESSPPDTEGAAGTVQSDAGSGADMMAVLLAQGRVVLDDLEFRTGSVELSETDPQSLRLLAAFLQANDTYKLALVGHTDSVGTLEDNIDLSRRRAAAVREVLISQHNVDENRIKAEGVGYLVPLASNLVPEGRQANRRVEAVLLVN